ncbi:MAG: alpha/beta hydrolase-fold protein [Ruminococcus sp.]
MSKFMKKIMAALTAAATIAASAIPMISQSVSVSAADTCVISTAKQYQTIRGFGGINHPEWTGQDMTEAQRKTAFGNGDNELGLTVLRVFVNPDSSQWNKALPTAQYASKMGAYVFASPWEPPSNLAESGGSNGKLHLPKSNYAAYAKHLNDFGTYMKNNGVDLYSISVQNEPDYASEWTYWSTDETTDFIANYGDQITSTRLMSPESFQYAPLTASWVPDGGKKFYQKIMNNSKAMENCDLFGTHFYGTQRAWMDYPELENCGKEIWMTEVYVPNSDADSANRYPEALQVSENIHNGLVVGNMSAYTWWYIRRSYGLMTEDGNISKRGYCMAQYSKYVRPGYVRIDATEQPADDVYISAYKGEDDKIVIVAVNKSTTGYAQNFSIGSGEKITNVDRYRTSANENLAKTASLEATDNSFFAQLPAESVSTFVVTVSGMDPTPGSDDPQTPVTPTPDENGYFFHDTFEGDTFDWNGRGAAEVTLSGRTAYKDAESLLVKSRTATWNGGTKALNAAAFVPGNEFSFSADVMYFDGDATETFYMKLQYTGSDGETHYDSIAEATAVKGSWVQLANTNYKIPEDATDMQLYIETKNGTNNFYIDEAIGAVAGTYIEGPAEITFTIGDLNCDGRINIFDVCEMKNGLKSGFTSSVYALAADVDQSDDVTIADAVQLHKYVVGLIDKFTVAEKPVSKMKTMSEYTPIVQAGVTEFETADSKTEKAGVTYGTVQSGQYYSTTCNRNKPYNILLPANYSTSKKYPVLYVMHGYWENQDRMILTGNGTMYTKQIVGNAIAEGAAEDMIVVFPYIYSSATQDSCSAMDDANNAAYDNFINDLTKDLMPHIESTYSVKTGRENTAITGFSMGGRESLLIGMQRPDLFGYVGAICPAPGVTGAFKWDSEEVAPSLLFITAGSNDTVVYSNPETYHNNFTANNVPHIWHYVNGGYHGDNSIHAHLYNFVRAVFKADK